MKTKLTKLDGRRLKLLKIKLENVPERQERKAL